MKHPKEKIYGPRKNQKFDRDAHVDPMVLTESNSHEIRHKFCDTTTKLWMQFKQQYEQELGNVQKDLCDLQIQTGWLQVIVGQVSGIQESL